ncbi:uncharacterized protein LOC104906239 isoform X2 [Beta vulgaris subsp. vulgaris]|uniref:uncharacterized protein LOC104906239 isoform X2 n=1 Tax=Beta vulgaris subsp. vulgaris TaxID=3555 RepID=UPI002036A55D|nr:uncharacterized protein LOC104906239 isoform X2 [Beta vulgaris subsp. vulgaris]
MDEDQRKEAEISSNPCLRPNFKSSAISQDQLAKFRELHRRRLQVKTKTKNKKKSKDKKDKFLSEEVDTQGCMNDTVDGRSKDSCAENSLKGKDSNAEYPSTCPVNFHPVLKKKKLHWGLDTRERWERKANM